MVLVVGMGQPADGGDDCQRHEEDEKVQIDDEVELSHAARPPVRRAVRDVRPQSCSDAKT